MFPRVFVHVVSCIKIDLFKHCTVSPGEEFYKRMRGRGSGVRGRVLIWFHLDSGPGPAALSEDSICITWYILSFLS